MVHATCAALHCVSSSHTNKDLKFHQFPHDAERRKIWISACKRSDVIDKDWDFFKHKYLCSKHFQKCMYSKKEHLKKCAIPSLHLSEKPFQNDSSTQTVESIQYTNQQSENDVSILDVMSKESFRTTHTQTEDSLPYDIEHVNIVEEKESESVERDVEIKTEHDDDADENSDSGAFEEDVEMKTERVDLEITKDGETLSTQPKNFLQDIDQGSTAPFVNRTSTYPINTTAMPILTREMDESIETDRVIVLRQNADGSAGSINPEECRCTVNNYLDMTRPQFYEACSKFLSADFAITVRRRMHLDDAAKDESSGPVRRRKTRSSESVELNATGCGDVVAPDVVITSTETAADSAENDLEAVESVEASAAVSAIDCAQSETRCPRTRGPRCGRGLRVQGERGGIRPAVVMEEVVMTATDRGNPSRRGRRRGGRANLRNERPEPRTIDELVNRDTSEMPEDQETALHPKRRRLGQPTNLAPSPPPSSVNSPAIVEPERPAACDLDKKNWDVTGNDHYDHMASRNVMDEEGPQDFLELVEDGEDFKLEGEEYLDKAEGFSEDEDEGDVEEETSTSEMASEDEIYLEAELYDEVKYVHTSTISSYTVPV